MTDILEELADLHVQATKERSHYYVGACVVRASTEIEILRATLLQQACLIPTDILRQAIKEQTDSDGRGQG